MCGLHRSSRMRRQALLRDYLDVFIPVQELSWTLLCRLGSSVAQYMVLAPRQHDQPMAVHRSVVHVHRVARLLGVAATLQPLKEAQAVSTASCGRGRSCSVAVLSPSFLGRQLMQWHRFGTNA